MADFLTLTCPTCGSKLKVTDKIHILVCASCGNEHMVHRDGGAIYLAPIAQDVQQIRVGVDKTAAELAMARLTKEIEQINAQIIEAEEFDYKTLVAPSDKEAFMPVLAGFAFVCAIISMIIGQPVALFGFVAVAVVCVFVYGLASEKRKKEARLLRDTEIGRLQQELDRAVKSLQQNRQIAESQSYLHTASPMLK